MTDVPPPTGLYPQPPQQQNALAGDPLKLIGVLGQINQLQRFQAEFGANKAIGGAYSNALRPDGTIDQGVLAQGMKDPAAAYGLPEAATRMQQQRAQQMLIDANAQKIVADAFSGVDPRTATPDTVHNLTTTLSRTMTGIPSATINAWANTALKDPQGLQHGIATMRNLALGAAGVSAPGPQAVSQDSGVPEQTNVGEFNIRAATGRTGGPSGTGAVPTGLPPGSAESAGAQQEALRHAGNFGQEILPLNQALDASNRLKAKYGEGYFAPGSQGRQEFQSFLYGISPSLSKTLGIDPAKLRDFAEAKKYLTQAVASRVGGFGAGTVEQLKTAAGGNPSVDINDMAVDQVLKMLIAARRMEHVQTNLANQGSPDGKRTGGPVNFTNNAKDWATRLDPKALMIDTMSAAEIREMEGSLKGAERKRFNQTLKAGISTDVISREKLDSILRGEGK